MNAIAAFLTPHTADQLAESRRDMLAALQQIDGPDNW